jgi:hypothetical protein
MPTALVTGGSNGPLAAESLSAPETLNGPLTLANQTAAPATPAAGAELYAVGGVLTYINTQGLVNTIVGSQGGIVTAGITTVANTSAETVLQSMSLPALDAIAGSVYKMVGWGTYSDTVTPTLAFGSRLGGVAGTSLSTIAATTLGSGVSNLAWRAELLLNFLSTTTAQVYMEVELGTSNSTNATTLLTSTPSSATTVSLTTTKAWVLTVTFSAASASNTISLLGGWTERVA